MGRPKGSKNSPKENQGNGQGSPEAPKGAAKVGGRNKIFKDPLYPIAKIIIDKFLDIRYKNVWRDVTVGLKLAKKFPSETFWRDLPCEHRVKNISVLAGEKGMEKLKMLWAVYQNRLKIDRQIKIPKNKPVDFSCLSDKVGEDYKQEKPKMKSILDFCREDGNIID